MRDALQHLAQTLTRFANAQHPLPPGGRGLIPLAYSTFRHGFSSTAGFSTRTGEPASQASTSSTVSP